MKAVMIVGDDTSRQVSNRDGCKHKVTLDILNFFFFFEDIVGTYRDKD